MKGWIASGVYWNLLWAVCLPIDKKTWKSVNQNKSNKSFIDFHLFLLFSYEYNSSIINLRDNNAKEININFQFVINSVIQLFHAFVPHFWSVSLFSSPFMDVRFSPNKEKLSDPLRNEKKTRKLFVHKSLELIRSRGCETCAVK